MVRLLLARAGRQAPPSSARAPARARTACGGGSRALWRVLQGGGTAESLGLLTVGGKWSPLPAGFVLGKMNPPRGALGSGPHLGQGVSGEWSSFYGRLW